MKHSTESHRLTSVQESLSTRLLTSVLKLHLLCAGWWESITQPSMTTARTRDSNSNTVAKRKKIVSYCRWSSDKGNSDVYVYEHFNGQFVIMVREQKFPEDFPKAPTGLEKESEDYAKAVRDYGKLLTEVEMVKLDLPLAGQEIRLDTLEEVYQKLAWMKGEGYRVPQFALDNILKEIGESENG